MSSGLNRECFRMSLSICAISKLTGAPLVDRAVPGKARRNKLLTRLFEVGIPEVAKCASDDR